MEATILLHFKCTDKNSYSKVTPNLRSIMVPYLYPPYSTISYRGYDFPNLILDHHNKLYPKVSQQCDLFHNNNKFN